MHRGLTSTLAVCAVAASFAFACPVQAAGSGLGAWRDYAARGLTPDFSWAEKPSEAAVRPTVIDTAFAPSSAMMKLSFAGGDVALGLSFSRSSSADAIEADGRFEPQRLTRSGMGLQRTFLSPSLTHAIDERTSVTAAAVLADQKFATLGPGSPTLVEYSQSLPGGMHESSFGTGVRVSLDQRLGETVGLTTGFQSRIDMDVLHSHRGVYGSPGDFDIPAIGSVGLVWSPVASHSFDFDVQRVQYSEVPAFASAALPSRVLQSLGDSDSPEFAWRDLTIYGVNWTWRATTRDALRLRYSTQQQPEPSDQRLRDALSEGFSDDNFSLAYMHDFGLGGTLEFAASYARSPYFMGNWSRPNRDLYGDQLEVEAIWSVDF
ncbi:MAG TPA: hypothetical protein VFO79_04815 [Xanthomonadales bacterium]|nr:hypothetical protein [Xanthomonadales bacterium]